MYFRRLLCSMCVLYTLCVLRRLLNISKLYILPGLGFHIEQWNPFVAILIITLIRPLQKEKIICHHPLSSLSEDLCIIIPLFSQLVGKIHWFYAYTYSNCIVSKVVRWWYSQLLPLLAIARAGSRELLSKWRWPISDQYHTHLEIIRFNSSMYCIVS